MGVSRREFCRAGITAAAAAGMGSVAYVAAQPAEQIVKILAKKYEFVPENLTLKRGVPVVLELTSADVAMGFDAPEFKVRADIFPGKVARMRILPERTGKFEYLCDVFCGSGHEEMGGTITVVD
jgi:cytochrome c oxidase subunit II